LIPNPLPGPYVALGDSYSSGEGAGPYFAKTDTSTNKCHRSANAWPALTATGLGVPAASFEFWACSGAVVADVVSTYHVGGTGQWNESVQIEHLNNRDGRLVTISVGGNDVAFGSIAKKCLGQTANSCRTAIRSMFPPRLALLQNGGIERITRDGGEVKDPQPCPHCKVGAKEKGDKLVLTTKLPSLTELYKDIAKRAPNAQIRVMLYPPLIPPTVPVLCSVYNDAGIVWLNLQPASVAAMAAAEGQLNAAITAAVATTGNPRIKAVDPAPGFRPGARGPGTPAGWLCNTSAIDIRGNPYLWNSNAMINGIVPTATVESLHPNVAGHTAMATALLAS
jgi:lysophospholipase L1-like esterase